MATFSCVKLWIHQLSLSGSRLDFVVWLCRIMGWYRMLEFINGYWVVFPFLNWTCLSQFFPFGNLVFLLSWPVQFFIFHESIIDQLTWIVECVNCLKFYVVIGVNSRGSVRIGLGRKLDFLVTIKRRKIISCLLVFIVFRSWISQNQHVVKFFLSHCTSSPIHMHKGAVKVFFLFVLSVKEPLFACVMRKLLSCYLYSCNSLFCSTTRSAKCLVLFICSSLLFSLIDA